MNLQDSEAFRQQLLIQQGELEALDEAARAAAKTVDLDQSSVGGLSRMDATQGQQMALEAAWRRQQELLMLLPMQQSSDWGQQAFCFGVDGDARARRVPSRGSAAQPLRGCQHG